MNAVVVLTLKRFLVLYFLTSQNYAKTKSRKTEKLNIKPSKFYDKFNLFTKPCGLHGQISIEQRQKIALILN